ncbi:hypothetical protein KIN20_003275 [Parelaphostrongylus tenuis]|uniref:Uncharacterized protein n=1 Tax=Parelaphostrongylus tenuis TaxID=148309 RepID=A0AAD5MPQ1_PARTN|nr:hypothetical protein KIN20_003275 [Parelaphostrongylus tenuis]
MFIAAGTVLDHITSTNLIADCLSSSKFQTGPCQVTRAHDVFSILFFGINFHVVGLRLRDSVGIVPCGGVNRHWSPSLQRNYDVPQEGEIRRRRGGFESLCNGIASLTGDSCDVRPTPYKFPYSSARVMDTAITIGKSRYSQHISLLVDLYLYYTVHISTSTEELCCT